jgi:FtsX-like permease family
MRGILHSGMLVRDSRSASVRNYEDDSDHIACQKRAMSAVGWCGPVGRCGELPVGRGVGLGFMVGTAIAGQTFYNFTLDNLRHFGALKAMGASNGTLLCMILLQALVVGSLGYGLGVGIAALFGSFLGSTELAFRLPWQLLGLSTAAITCICLASALLSICKVRQLEPAMVFKG